MGFTVSVMKSRRAMTCQLETPLNVHGNLKTKPVHEVEQC